MVHDFFASDRQLTSGLYTEYLCDELSMVGCSTARCCRACFSNPVVTLQHTGYSQCRLCWQVCMRTSEQHSLNVTMPGTRARPGLATQPESHLESCPAASGPAKRMNLTLNLRPAASGPAKRAGGPQRGAAGGAAETRHGALAVRCGGSRDCRHAAHAGSPCKGHQKARAANLGTQHRVHCVWHVGRHAWRHCPLLAYDANLES